MTGAGSEGAGEGESRTASNGHTKFCLEQEGTDRFEIAKEDAEVDEVSVGRLAGA